MKFFSWLFYPFIILCYWLFFLIARHFLGAQPWLLLVIILLAILGPLANWLIRKVTRDLLILRALYLISFVWLGLMFNLALAAGIIYILEIIVPLSSLFALIAWLVFGSGASLIGNFLAACPRVRREEVYIKDLPVAWEGKCIAHISDLHLGPIYRHRFFGRVLKKIRGLNAEALFITGDLFDDVDLEFDWVGRLLEGFSAPGGIYYSFGNHDLMLGLGRVKSVLANENLKILDNEKIERNGLQIIGLDFSYDHQSDLGQSLAQVGQNPQQPSILLFHEPRDIAAFKGRNIGLMLSGHTHYGQMFPVNFLTSWYYHGYDRGLYREKDFSLSVCVGTGTWGPPMRTSSRSEIVAITLKKKP